MKKEIIVYSIFIILSLSTFNCISTTIQDYKTYEWEQVVDHGFENKNNLHAWSMKEYKGFLYIGTRNVVDGCQIYRSETGDKDTWIQVNKDGFCNDNKSEGARNMIVYKDLLWIITNSWDHGSQVWVTNGEINETGNFLTWKKANLNGFGEGKKILSSRGIGIFQNNLYVGSHSEEDHPLVFRYDGPTNFEDINPEEWTLVKDWYYDPNYNPDLFLAADLVNFKNKDGKNFLYTILVAGVTPLLRELKANFTLKNLFNTLRILFFGKSQIWRYDGINWELINSEVFKKSNLMGSCFHIFNNSLYIGTANWLGGEIWKTDDGENWTQVSKRGFYRPFNLWVWKMHDFQNRLIAGTLNPVIGCQVWVSTSENPKSPKDFIKISKNGMSGPRLLNIQELPQDGARSFETFNGNLYVGTTNWIDLNTFFKGTGCEVWRIGNIDKLSYT